MLRPIEPARTDGIFFKVTSLDLAGQRQGEAISGHGRARPLHPSLSQFIAIVGVPLLFLPKINLVSIAGQSAGLRIDDFALLFLTAILITAFCVGAKRGLSKVEAAFLAVVLSSFVSNSFNMIVNEQSNLLYTIRWIEYFAFFYIGICASKHLRSICWALIYLNGIVMVLQAAGLAGGFSSEGFQSTAGYRPYGLTGGPWEVGTVINISVAVLLTTGQRRPWALFLLTFPLILLSGARSPLVVHMVLLVVEMYRRSPNKISFLFRGVVTTAASALFLLTVPNPVIERSTALLKVENIQVAGELYRNIELKSKFGDLETASSVEGDASWLIRVTKWMYATKQWLHAPVAWIIGFGPGTWGPALDGGWLRLLTETGIVGLLLFVNLFKHARYGLMTRAVVLCLFLNMVFIDIHIAYKAMALVFFVIGTSHASASQTPRSSSEAPG